MIIRVNKQLSWYANGLNHIIRVFGFLVLAVVAIEVYRHFLSDIITGKSYVFAFIVLWFFTAYIFLPRIYRLLAKLFLPDYFIGRAITGDGLLGDPINLALLGTENQLLRAMEAAGWVRAQDLSLSSSIKMTYKAFFGASYPNAPVSSLFLFGNKQMFAFEQDIDGNPRKRHHVRIWKTPGNWWLPGGYKADWLGAATFDEHVGISLFTGQITHSVDANVDKERNFVLQTLKSSQPASTINMVEHFTTGYHGRNGEGDAIHTDGTLPFVSLPA
jgi:hypothetical protein